MKTALFDFDLPESFIAKYPLNPRDSSKLLYVPNLENYHVYDLPKFFNKGDLLILNDTKVLPVRIYGKKGIVNIEATLHKMIKPNLWWAFAKPGKRLKVGDVVNFAGDLNAEVMEKNDEFGILFSFLHDSQDIFQKLEKFGEMPLPPYIKREITDDDKNLYQTIYAKNLGAVASPTAGLHFTDNLFDAINNKGIKKAYVTLHVGAGTFLPVKTDDTKDHKMHFEYGIITNEVAALVNETRKNGDKIICVGTTSLRVLESASDEKGLVHPFAKETGIFITPGYKFKTADYLMTNFHLPKSTLFMLVCAFSGIDTMKNAYEFAKKNNYRFYSYGDSSLLKCENHI